MSFDCARPVSAPLFDSSQYRIGVISFYGAARNHPQTRTFGALRLAAEMAFFSLDLAALPDELYDDAVPDEKWFDRVQKVGPGGFAAGSLSAVSPLALGPHLERIINIPLYLTLNWLPFVLPLCAGGLYGWSGLLVLAVALAVGSYAQNLVSPSAERQRAGQSSSGTTRSTSRCAWCGRPRLN